MPEMTGCIWRDIAYETEERSSYNIVFFHLLAVDVVRQY
jgi:hypothetical protein